MRHRVRAGVLGRSSSHRLAMYRNLVTSLLEHERVKTTDAKAKGVRRLAERMITLGKRGDLHARRRALRVIRSRRVAAKVFDDLAERFRDRPGGYTRIVKVGNRVGDAAPMSVIELVEGAEAVVETPAKKAGARGKAKKAEKAEPKKKAAAKKAEADEPKKKTAKKKAESKKKTAKKKAEPKKKTTKKKTAKKKATSKKKSSKKK
jgi:large subunit ribosomal protein L17